MADSATTYSEACVEGLCDHDAIDQCIFEAATVVVGLTHGDPHRPVWGERAISGLVHSHVTRGSEALVNLRALVERAGREREAKGGAV